MYSFVVLVLALMVVLVLVLALVVVLVLVLCCPLFHDPGSGLPPDRAEGHAELDWPAGKAHGTTVGNCQNGYSWIATPGSK